MNIGDEQELHTVYKGPPVQLGDTQHTHAVITGPHDAALQREITNQEQGKRRCTTHSRLGIYKGLKLCSSAAGKSYGVHLRVVKNEAKGGELELDHGRLLQHAEECFLSSRGRVIKRV